MTQRLKQILSRAPIRICDIGGWTDTWFSRRGTVFNMAVTPCAEVQVICRPARAKERVTFRLENLGEVYAIDPDQVVYGKHPILDAVVEQMGVPEGLALEITVRSNAPSGASVGSSAAVSVALIGALDALTPGRMTPVEVAAGAHRIETEKVGLQAGVQDQYASACGGIHLIRMTDYPHVSLQPLRPPAKLLEELEDRLILVYINQPHFSSKVHEKVIAGLGPDAAEDSRLEGLRSLASEAAKALLDGDLAALGDCMNRNTALQRALHPDLVCRKFEKVIGLAESFDALGCKVNGAGGDGGSITILGSGGMEEKQRLIDAIEGQGFRTIPLTLSRQGLSVRVSTTERDGME